ncbi:gamma-glutamyl-gamma-aminobutyrate hydrolase family protein [Undibacterium sp.]|uniref:gamma-glutamyl-gamma-aminobutyrate hydrolase family protein n=1 Tax=Undibacterium sp. TaxID=1914977 RepID=UPI00374D5EB9
MSKPVIAITPDRDNGAEDIEAHFFIRRNYCSAIADGGGTAIVLPYRMDAVDDYLDLADGIVLSGGMFDIAPALYGAASSHPDKVVLKEDRTRFEQAVLRGALERRMPILGICGGMQLIAVELGGQLHQHLPSDLQDATEHKQQAPCNEATHRIRIQRGSQLHRILGADECSINSLHHQAVIRGNSRFSVGAVADDGVIESIEASEYPFCIGVQWHPEYAVNDCERLLFAELVRAAACMRR